MLVCVFLRAFAHETAGAARTRLSLRPLLPEGEKLRKARAFHAARMRTHALAPSENSTRKCGIECVAGRGDRKAPEFPESKGCLSKAGVGGFHRFPRPGAARP